MEGRSENNSHLSHYSLSIVSAYISLWGSNDPLTCSVKILPKKKVENGMPQRGIALLLKGFIVVSEETLAGIESALGNAWCYIFVWSFGHLVPAVCKWRGGELFFFPCHINPVRIQCGGERLESLVTSCLRNGSISLMCVLFKQYRLSNTGHDTNNTQTMS